MTQLDRARSGDQFGRGGATTFQQDLQNSDCIVIMGSNMAECHPVGFQWVMEAKERGATVIHVDPRFTRTSAMADVHVPIRAGSDIAFLGGLIRHVLEQRPWFETSGTTQRPGMVREDFKDTEELGGLFRGFVPEKRRLQARELGLSGDSGRPADRRQERADRRRLRRAGPRRARHDAARRPAAARGNGHASTSAACSSS